MLSNSLSAKNLKHNILQIAIPISLQSLFQSSLSVIDQIMVGQLGTNSITAIGLGSKFPSLFIITLAAIGTSASIMISQYCGSDDSKGVNHSFISNGLLAAIITLIFLLPSIIFSRQIISLYTTDKVVIPMASKYVLISSIGYIPLLITAMLSSMLRSTNNAKAPMIASIISVISNTALNYLLIFGNFGMPKLGTNGSAIATTIARIIECLILLFLFFKVQKTSKYKISFHCRIPRKFVKQTLFIANPIVINEFLWGFGDTLYAVIYGRIGTAQMAAMTLTNPIQSLSIGLFTGVSTAAAILVGNRLGQNDDEAAYDISKKFIRISVLGSVAFGILIIAFSRIYAGFFNISSSTKQTTALLLCVFAIVLFSKVSNMVLAGGILRSGGKTKYTLFLDLFGTWVIGIPLGFLSAFEWHLPIYYVYFLISTEEIVRFIMGMFIFKSKKWMDNITDAA